MGVPSWNLERSLSQWGLAAGWQDSPLGDWDASEWSAGGGSGGAGRRGRASRAHCGSSSSGQAASSSVPGGPARCFTFLLHQRSHYAEEKGKSFRGAGGGNPARRPSSVRGVSSLCCHGRDAAPNYSGAGHRRCPLLLQMPVADLARPARSSKCYFPSRDVVLPSPSTPA